MPLKISGYILLCLSLVAGFATPAMAQQNDTAKAHSIQGVQYTPSNDAAVAKANAKIPMLAGFSVSGNLAGALLAAISSYGEYEGAVRANLRGKYFPVIECGIGTSNHKDDATDLRYKTSAPFFRVGMDYNVLRDKTSGNRVLAGARLAYTSFKYDISGPDLFDPVWHDSTPYSFKDVSGKQAWIELVFGVETRIWSIFHLGWTVRYKNKLMGDFGSEGGPWYVPGFGKKGTSSLGATFNLIFDIQDKLTANGVKKK